MAIPAIVPDDLALIILYVLYCTATRVANGIGVRPMATDFSTNQCLARKTPCHLLAFELYYWYTHFDLPYIYIFQKKIAEEKEKEN